MELEATFTCAYCFSINDTVVDTSGGLFQKYVEDCRVCCRPNVLRISVNEELTDAEVISEPE